MEDLNQEISILGCCQPIIRLNSNLVIQVKAHTEVALNYCNLISLTQWPTYNEQVPHS